MDGNAFSQLINGHDEEWDPGIVCHIFMIVFFARMWNVEFGA